MLLSNPHGSDVTKHVKRHGDSVKSLSNPHGSDVTRRKLLRL